MTFTCEGQKAYFQGFFAVFLRVLLLKTDMEYSGISGVLVSFMKQSYKP